MAPMLSLGPMAGGGCYPKSRVYARSILPLGILWLLAFALSDTLSADDSQLIDTDPLVVFEQASAELERGQLRQAAEKFQNAARRFEHLGDPGGQIRALLHLGECRQSLGYHHLASTTLAAVRQLAATTNDRAALAAAARIESQGAIFSRNADHAERELLDSLRQAESDNDLDAAAGIYNNLGNLYAARGDYEQADACHGDAAHIADNLGNPLIAAQAATNLASTLVARGDFPAAQQQSVAGSQRARLLSDGYAKGHLLLALGENDRQIAERSTKTKEEMLLAASQTAGEAKAIADVIGNRPLAGAAWGFMGRLHEMEGRHEAALQCTRQAAFIAQEQGDIENLYRWRWQTGRILRAMKCLAEAILAYQLSVDALESIRNDVSIGYGNDNYGSSYRNSVGAVYFELADLLLEQAADCTDPACAQATLRDARGVVERLKSAELEDYFRDACVDLARSRLQEVDSIGDRTAVVYIVPLPTRTEFLLTLPSGLRRVQHNVGAEALTTAARKFRWCLEKRGTHQYLPLAQTLYDELIRPIESVLVQEQLQTLVFVPDGALLSIPMAALHDGARFLVERYNIAVIPGLTLMDPRPIHRHKARILLGGVAEAVQGFPALPYVPKELDDLQTILPGRRLQDEGFRHANLQQALAEDQYSIVHIATHGEFHRHGKQSFLLTHDGRLTLDAVEELIRPYRVRGTPVELLTLSACQTAAGDDRAALGLAGVALKAGARSVLATLWAVNDESSALLFTEFYRQLINQPTQSKAAALRHSQSVLLSDARFRHPGYWSAYLLIGNWL